MSDYIGNSVSHLATTLAKKNHDYRVDDEFSNFEQSAKIAGITPLQLITAQIAIKMTRIQGLSDEAVSNESLQDSYLDLAGYAIIAHAYLEAGESVVIPFYRGDGVEF